MLSEMKREWNAHLAKAFYIMKKRHHCRCCGDVCCSDCSPSKVSLLINTSIKNLNDTSAQRICGYCHEHASRDEYYCLRRLFIILTEEESEIGTTISF